MISRYYHDVLLPPPLNNFGLDICFDKSNGGLHFLLIPSMLAKFHGDQRSIIITIMKCIKNVSFLYFKICK